MWLYSISSFSIPSQRLTLQGILYSQHAWLFSPMSPVTLSRKAFWCLWPEPTSSSIVQEPAPPALAGSPGHYGCPLTLHKMWAGSPPTSSSYNLTLRSPETSFLRTQNMGTKALFASEQSSNKMRRFVCRPAKIESACLSSTGEVTAGELTASQRPV